MPRERVKGRGMPRPYGRDCTLPSIIDKMLLMSCQILRRFAPQEEGLSTTLPLMLLRRTLRALGIALPRERVEGRGMPRPYGL